MKKMSLKIIMALLSVIILSGYVHAGVNTTKVTKSGPRAIKITTPQSVGDVISMQYARRTDMHIAYPTLEKYFSTFCFTAKYYGKPEFCNAETILTVDTVVVFPTLSDVLVEKTRGAEEKVKHLNSDLLKRKRIIATLKNQLETEKRQSGITTQRTKEIEAALDAAQQQEVALIEDLTKAREKEVALENERNHLKEVTEKNALVISSLTEEKDMYVNKAETLRVSLKKEQDALVASKKFLKDEAEKSTVLISTLAKEKKKYASEAELLSGKLQNEKKALARSRLHTQYIIVTIGMALLIAVILFIFVRISKKHRRGDIEIKSETPQIMRESKKLAIKRNSERETITFKLPKESPKQANRASMQSFREMGYPELLMFEVVPTPAGQDGVYVKVPGLQDPVLFSAKKIMQKLNRKTVLDAYYAGRFLKT